MGPPGHFAIALAAKPTAQKVPLWVFLLASELLDLLCFAFAAMGIETIGTSQTDIYQGMQILSPSYLPWSHGLFMSVVWSLVTGVIIFLIYKDKKTAGILGLVVFSHWVLDFIVHLPELPLLFGGSPEVGLGMWGSGTGLIISGILEIVMLAGGLAIYWVNRKRKLTEASV